LNIKYFNGCIDSPNQKAHNKLELKPYSANESKEDWLPIYNAKKDEA